MNWYPQPIGELDSPRVRRLTDSCGAEGAGVWFAAKCELYRAAAEGLQLTFAELSRAVSRDLGISRKKATSVLETAARCGVFEVKRLDGVIELDIPDFFHPSVRGGLPCYGILGESACRH